MNKCACCDDCNVCCRALVAFRAASLPFRFKKYLCFSYFKRGFFCGDDWRFFSAETDVNGCVCFCGGDRRLFCFYGVARRNDNHSRHNPHDGNVLDSLMRPAVWTHRNTCMRTSNFHRPVVVANSGPDLLPVSAWRKHGVRRHERNFAHGGHTRSSRREVLLGHADFHNTLWKFLGKKMGLRRFGEVGAKRHHSRIGFARRKQALTVSFSDRHKLDIFVKKFWVEVRHVRFLIFPYIEPAIEPTINQIIRETTPRTIAPIGKISSSCGVNKRTVIYPAPIKKAANTKIIPPLNQYGNFLNLFMFAFYFTPKSSQGA